MEHPEPPPKFLVVILHGYTCNVSSYNYIKKHVLQCYHGATILLPNLNLWVFSNSNPNELARKIIDEIDTAWESAPYDKIILIGHSCGALLARKVYLYACGENKDAPFEMPGFEQPKAWSSQVSRIVLFAGMNRGWSVNMHLSLLNSLAWEIGVILGHILSIFQYKVFIFELKKGAPFITQLRLQWLSMLDKAALKKTGNTIVIQLLGTIDDLVSPDDNVDMITGSNFYYLDVPLSGHMNVLKMDGSEAGKKRSGVFKNALVLNEKQLEELQIGSQEQQRLVQRTDVSDVVFVIHGIRDVGYWTKKIARRVQKLANEKGLVFETETSSYGYFPMLPFLLFPARREKVEWLMDQYTENRARYPRANFSFIGHSNGTYLLARALEDYPACRFKNIIFAGSVVNRQYNWRKMIHQGRIERVTNLVASADWVVAIFPKAFQTLKIQDLGSGGHDGFTSLNTHFQLRYIKGDHGAGIKEELWDSIAGLIIDGKTAGIPADSLVSKQNSFVKILGVISPLIFLILIALIILGGIAVVQMLSGKPVTQTIALLLYAGMVWKVITKI